MLVLSTLFTIFCLLLAPAQTTRLNVKFSVKCQHKERFKWKTTILEWDTYKAGYQLGENDWKESGRWWAPTETHLETTDSIIGYHNNDFPGGFGVVLKFMTSCGEDKSNREHEHRVQIQDCPFHVDQCNYTVPKPIDITSAYTRNEHLYQIDGGLLTANKFI